MKFIEYLIEEKTGKTPKTSEDDYGQEVIMDIHNCDVSTFTNKSIEKYLQKTCDIAKMKRAELHWWEDKKKQEIYDEENHPYHAGISCCQFIETSSIVIHTIIPWKKIFIDFFTCKTFNAETIKNFTVDYFKGELVSFHDIVRK